uniref:Uncharacterized protein n=2 Tax=Musca domestica TaxID=7370 RepID=A0A1I8NJW1_MUSDO
MRTINIPILFLLYAIGHGEAFSSQMEMNMYHSSTGKNDYRALPFRIYRQHVIDILNSVYKEGAMENFASCSNLPQFEDKFEPPLVKDTYYMDKCQFDESGFPNHAQEGFYKIEVIGYGEVDWTMILVFKLDADV